MAHPDLDLVQADLAAMKRACAEPVVPSEEFKPSLAIGLFGLLMAAAAWFISITAMKVAVVAFAIAGLAIYIPWKRRILKSDPVGRRMERTELALWALAAFGSVIFLGCHRLLGSGQGVYDFVWWRQDAGAIMFFLGLAGMANALLHATRRYSLPWSVSLMLCGLAQPFLESTAAAYAAFGAMLAIGGLSAAGWLYHTGRHSESLHGGN